MISEIIIRPAGSGDVQAITDIYAFHVKNGTASFDTQPRTQAESQEKIDICQSRGWPFIVAVQNDEVLGYAYATQFRDRPAYASTCENSIYLRADRRGFGIGTQLLHRLLIEAEACGFRQMIAVAGGGEVASVGLHIKLGFRETGRMHSVGRKFGKWLDTVYLQRALGAGDTVAPLIEP